jgi:hypothetical protein
MKVGRSMSERTPTADSTCSTACHSALQRCQFLSLVGPADCRQREILARHAGDGGVPGARLGC